MTRSRSARRVRRRAARVGRVGEPGEAGSFEALAPQQDRHERDAELGGDPPVRGALGGAQDDPGALDQTLLGRPRPDQRPEDLEIGLIDRQAEAPGWLAMSRIVAAIAISV